MVLSSPLYICNYNILAAKILLPSLKSVPIMLFGNVNGDSPCFAVVSYSVVYCTKLQCSFPTF